MLIIFLLFLVQQACSVTVETPKGPIVGQRASDGNYTTFFGVPYAHVDENKPFEDTREYPNFSTPFNASDPTIMCPQVIFKVGGILQCLRLNIYVPHVPNNSNLPIFVWFHGGGLAFGTAGEYNATHLVQEGIIVVTANYRLGPYGFLCTSDIKNQGLEDQKTALKWIKANIKSFGGNPDKVTIAGESWGGSAVDFLLYEKADFNQAIIESGTRFSYAVSTRKDTEVLIKLAAGLGYNTNKYKDALRFLNSAKPMDVMRAYNDMDYVFAVCEKPGDFKLKLNAKYAEKIRNTPIMIGYTSKETFDDIASQPDSYYSTVEDDFYNSLGKVFDLKNETLRNLADIVWRFYLGEKTISRESMLEIIDLSSDFQENYGTERSVTNYLKLQNPKVYKYVYAHIGEESKYKNWTGVGAYHTQELPYLFEWGTQLETEEQFRMRRFLVKLWTNFVKYGDPTPDHSEVTWQPTNLATRPYLHIDTKSEMRNYVYHKRMAFWELIWTAYGSRRK